MVLLSIDNITVAVLDGSGGCDNGSVAADKSGYIPPGPDHLSSRHHGPVSDGWENVRILTLAGYGHCHSVRISHDHHLNNKY